MRNRDRLTAGFAAVLFLLFMVPGLLSGNVVLAAGMTAETEAQEVRTGEKVAVTVSFSGTEIWYALVRISPEDPLLEGGGSFLIEPEEGQESVSETFYLQAVSPGTTRIRVEGYTDEDESQVYEMFIPVTITGDASGGAAVSGNRRTADVDQDFRDANGEYINRREPPAEVSGVSEETETGNTAETAVREEAETGINIKNETEAGEEQTAGQNRETKPGEEQTAGQDKKTKSGKTSEKDKLSVIWGLVLFGMILLVAGPVVLLIIWNSKKRFYNKEKTKDEEKE